VLIYATLRILLYYLSVSYVYTIKPRHRTVVRPSCVKMALICKNGVKVRTVRVRVRVRDRIRVRVRVRIRVSVSSLYRQGPHFYR